MPAAPCFFAAGRACRLVASCRASCAAGLAARALPRPARNVAGQRRGALETCRSRDASCRVASAGRASHTLSMSCDDALSGHRNALSRPPSNSMARARPNATLAIRRYVAPRDAASAGTQLTPANWRLYRNVGCSSRTLVAAASASFSRPSLASAAGQLRIGNDVCGVGLNGSVCGTTSFPIAAAEEMAHRLRVQCGESPGSNGLSRMPRSLHSIARSASPPHPRMTLPRM
jgi:hypothetical protein